MEFLKIPYQYAHIVCVALAVCSTLAFPSRAEESAAVDPDPARFAAEIHAFEEWDRKNSVPPGTVLFIGSSSVRMWPTAESFPHLPLINRGFGGSHISDVNH